MSLNPAFLWVAANRTRDGSRMVASLDRKRRGHSFGAKQNLDPRRFRSRLATIRELTSSVNVIPSGRSNGMECGG